MIEVIDNRVSCENCLAACCKGPESILLSDKEAKFLRKAGARLVDVIKPKPEDRLENMPAKFIPVGDDKYSPEFWSQPVGFDEIDVPGGYGIFRLLGDCPFLVSNMCSIYDDPQKPAVCSEFAVGSEDCLSARTDFYFERYDIGDWTPVELTCPELD